ncbi:hypothetical protein GUITHDRAFT_118511 [Guillardia theta CCMP2712]|uniref:Peptidylprolyl isomerase n=1 Tax=Guillardia theta (strain CCMP2712) TaxID=905079 RepID=L1IGD5_GUITC|nr:hypothetical protein GUITHDRAFT_118511 [Guillardia theta CCMP2712]EKX35273.1 hypothetical protein GUITHDRAFT_118511 [Guillardia theta CCMP2712]|eukprot:XP_005822253.1 hypothetical protein GUITHDRAFT_118511 [Guillardia theta CCMP2712]
MITAVLLIVLSLLPSDNIAGSHARQRPCSLQLHTLWAPPIHPRTLGLRGGLLECCPEYPKASSGDGSEEGVEDVDALPDSYDEGDEGEVDGSDDARDGDEASEVDHLQRMLQQVLKSNSSAEFQQALDEHPGPGFEKHMLLEDKEYPGLPKEGDDVFFHFQVLFNNSVTFDSARQNYTPMTAIRMHMEEERLSVPIDVTPVSLSPVTDPTCRLSLALNPVKFWHSALSSMRRGEKSLFALHGYNLEDLFVNTSFLGEQAGSDLELRITIHLFEFGRNDMFGDGRILFECLHWGGGDEPPEVNDEVYLTLSWSSPGGVTSMDRLTRPLSDGEQGGESKRGWVRLGSGKWPQGVEDVITSRFHRGTRGLVHVCHLDADAASWEGESLRNKQACSPLVFPMPPVPLDGWPAGDVKYLLLPPHLAAAQVCTLDITLHCWNRVLRVPRLISSLPAGQALMRVFNQSDITKHYMLETDQVHLLLQQTLVSSHLLSPPAQLSSLDLSPLTFREYQTRVGDGELPLALEAALLELQGIRHLQLLVPGGLGLDSVGAGEGGNFQEQASSGQALLLEARVLHVSPREWTDELEGVLEHARRRHQQGVQLYLHNLTAAALVKFSSALKLTQYMLHHNMEERNRVDMTSVMERLEEDCPSIFNLGRPECRPAEEEDAVEENRLSDELKREVKKFHFDLLLNAAQCMLKEQQWQQVIALCDRAEVIQKSVKLFFRRARAHQMLKDYSAAEADLRAALAKSPGNKLVERELR